MAVINVKNRTLCISLIVILQFTIFWLGRFSAQISNLDSQTDNLKKCPEEEHRDVERTDADKPSTYLFIAIMSEPNDVERRQAIRETWLKLSTKTPQLYRYIFPIGAKDASANEIAALKDEQARTSDLVLFTELAEDYRKLSRKTAATIRHAVENFNFEFFLKVDVDTFVRLGKFLSALRDVAHPRLYWGFLDGRAKPFRKGKWKELDWILCDRYLPYQLGGGYVLSGAIANYIAKNHNLLRFYAAEDVAVGAWIAGLDVKYIHDPRFDTEFTSRGCNNEYLVTHKQTVKNMHVYFANIRDRGALCTEERQIRSSYIYDFNVPPSKCCVRRNDSSVP